jgi:antitoxin (DNA-binding transcriptional repressor) of toxin-antitoxin stability system
MKTTMLNINEAKAKLSEYARRVQRGERIVLCNRNKPFAEIRKLRLDEHGRRPFGLAKGLLSIREDLTAPDQDIDELFGGPRT